MEINAKQNPHRNYWIAAIAITLIPEVIYLIVNGLGDSDTVAYWIGYRIGIASVYFIGIALISGGFFLGTFFCMRNWDFMRFLKMLILFSIIYVIISLYYRFVS
ncbi:MAG: hypothetical protein R8G66_34445 [Cytophagales bacterium]|nr:hypothetical protein [Cytophagales bacterium]